MKRVWKFPLPFAVSTSVIAMMPAGATILNCAMQGDYVCLWAAVDPTKDLEARTFVMIGTGTPYDDATHTYVGGFMTDGDHYVWHVFERIP